MIRLADTDVVGMYLVRKHDIDYIALGGRSCTNRGMQMYTISMQQVPTLHTLKNYCEQYCKRDTTEKYVGRL